MNSNQPDVSPEPPPTNQPAGNTASPIPAKSEFSVSDIFLGREGLRAGWGIVLFLLLREALRDCVYPILHALFPSAFNEDSLIAPRSLFAPEGAGVLCVVIATWAMAKFEQRPVSVYGFTPHRSVRYFLSGLAWGVALLSLLVATLHATGLLVFDARLLFGGSALRYGLTWLAGFLLVGLLEELLLRGYLQFTLTRGLSSIYRGLFGPSHANGLGFWTAAIILSAVFGLGHSSNPGESPLGLVAACLVGLVFCLSLWRTGSLWWAIGFHTAWDWAESFLYGVADSGLMVKGHLFATHAVGRPLLSGGLTGPEGSLYFLPVVLAGVAVVLLTLPRTHFGYTPAATPPPALH